MSEFQNEWIKNHSKNKKRYHLSNYFVLLFGLISIQEYKLFSALCFNALIFSCLIGMLYGSVHMLTDITTRSIIDDLENDKIDSDTKDKFKFFKRGIAEIYDKKFDYLSLTLYVLFIPYLIWSYNYREAGLILFYFTSTTVVIMTTKPVCNLFVSKLDEKITTQLGET